MCLLCCWVSVFSSGLDKFVSLVVVFCVICLYSLDSWKVIMVILVGFSVSSCWVVMVELVIVMQMRCKVLCLGVSLFSVLICLVIIVRCGFGFSFFQLELGYICCVSLISLWFWLCEVCLVVGVGVCVLVFWLVLLMVSLFWCIVVVMDVVSRLWVWICCFRNVFRVVRLVIMLVVMVFLMLFECMCVFVGSCELVRVSSMVSEVIRIGNIVVLQVVWWLVVVVIFGC